MTTQEAMLLAVLREPADDTVRLAYADFLDELGDQTVPCYRCEGKGTVERYEGVYGEMDLLDVTCDLCEGGKTIVDTFNGVRAEFIRKQIELDQLHRAGYSVEDRDEANFPETAARGVRVYDLSRRCANILEDWEQGLVRPLGEIGWQANSTWVPECEWEVGRGFVSHIRLSASHFLVWAPKIFAAQPVTRVTLEFKTPANSSPTPPLHDSSLIDLYPCAWYRERSNPAAVSDELPGRLFDELQLIRHPDQNAMVWNRFRTPEAALETLSRAAVNYGRVAAGLPRLYTA